MDALPLMIRRTSRAVLAAALLAVVVGLGLWGAQGGRAAAAGALLAWGNWQSVARLLRWGMRAPAERAGLAVVGLYVKGALWLGAVVWLGMVLGLASEGLLLGLSSFVAGVGSGALLSVGSMRGLAAAEG